MFWRELDVPRPQAAYHFHLIRVKFHSHVPEPWNIFLKQKSYDEDFYF